MASNGLFNTTIALLEKALDLRSLRHNVIAANIANMDTPNYKAFEVLVEEELGKFGHAAPAATITRTHPNHLAGRNAALNRTALKIADPPGFSLRGDGNTVEVDKAMGQLAENTVLYKTAAELIATKFKGLKNVIKGGK
ncbi:MAG: flagellar basal body rod protein FlgB [Desulfobacterales bacterium]|nr:MAG: flagellar basal body rod protein FlgB [Desulfobacterales bacterium]